jgi:hypothetical protein
MCAVLVFCWISKRRHVRQANGTGSDAGQWSGRGPNNIPPAYWRRLRWSDLAGYLAKSGCRDGPRHPKLFCLPIWGRAFASGAAAAWDRRALNAGSGATGTVIPTGLFGRERLRQPINGGLQQHVDLKPERQVLCTTTDSIFSSRRLQMPEMAYRKKQRAGTCNSHNT